MYIGITAEWNPFHQGHEKLIKTLKTDFPDAPVVCAMSGAFVQRGEPAVFEKWDRAVWAIRSGIDLAVELPAVCVLQSADRFAEFGALLLSDLGCTHLAFGAESLSAADFYKIADWSLSASFSRQYSHNAASAASATFIKNRSSCFCFSSALRFLMVCVLL